MLEARGGMFMKKIFGLGVLALSCGAGFVQLACSSGSGSAHTTEPGADPKMEDLIGSVAVNSASLDGIGSLGLVYSYGYSGAGGGGGGDIGMVTGGAGPIFPAPIAAAGIPGIGGSPEAAGSGVGGGCGAGCGVPFYPQCTGTLVSKNSVLTSRACGNLFEQAGYYYSASLKFAIGADSASPKQLIDVVDVEYAPGVVQGSGIFYPDLAVLHLGESVSGVAAFPVALLSDDLIGKQVAAVGFGDSDRRYRSGTRRAGALTVRATSGLLYPAIFGSFDAFYAYILGGGGYGVGGGYNASGGAAFIGGPAVPADFPEKGGSGPIPSAGAGGAFPSAGSPSAGTAGSPDDWYRQYLQQQYDSVALAPGEAYLGGTDDDAQPCGADKGGPIVRKVQNQVRVLGVFSHTPFGGCDKGGIYAAITSSAKAFIDAAAQWKDPCTGTTQNGKCAGNVATRCSTPAEGKRRLVKFDCSLLNQMCVASPNLEVTCTDK